MAMRGETKVACDVRTAPRDVCALGLFVYRRPRALHTGPCDVCRPGLFVCTRPRDVRMGPREGALQPSDVRMPWWDHYGGPRAVRKLA